MRMDYIFIQGLRVPATIGAYPEEHHAPQTLLIDVEAEARLYQAGMADDLALTVDYAAVASRIRTCAAEGRFHLLEALAEKLVRCLFTEFPILRLRLKVCKPGALPEADMVGVVVHRDRLSVISPASC